jgi:hypothetical protein
MAYQPLFCTMTDDYGRSVQTRSRSKTVESVRIWVNSKYGEVVTVRAAIIDGTRIVDRPDLRSVPKDRREKVMDAYHAQVERESRVEVYITPLGDCARLVVVGRNDEISVSQLTDLERFISGETIGLKHLPYSYLMGMMPEYMEWMKHDKGAPEYRTAQDKFMQRRDEILAMFEAAKTNGETNGNT